MSVLGTGGMETEAVTAKKRGRFFYGWLIVAIAFLGDFISAGIGAYAFGLFFKPMSEELGWTRAMTAGALTMRNLMGAVSSPIIGPLVDRKHGPRVLMTVGGLLGGLAIMGLSRVSALWHFYMAYGVLGALGMIGLGGLVTNTVVAKWFIRKRGRAMAIATMGISSGGLVLVPLTQWAISSFGWRTAWVVLGCLIWVVIVVPAALLIRRSPEDIGLRPDGDEIEVRDTGSATPSIAVLEAEALHAEEEVWTLRAAVKTPTLWLLVAVFNLGGMSIMVTHVHVVAYLTDEGYSSAVAAAAVTVFAFCAGISKLIWGLMAERMAVRYCVIGCYLLTVVGLAILLNPRNVQMVFSYAVVFGLGIGGTAQLNPLTWANYFGRTFLGTIRGVLSPINLLSNAGGPLLAGYLYDITGDYQLPFTILLSGALLAALLMFFAKPPKQDRLASG